MTREEMLKEYEEQGMMGKGTIKITLEIPKLFEKDLHERGLLGNENRIVECFDRVLTEVEIENMPTIGRYDKETLEMLKVSFANVETVENIICKDCKYCRFESIVGMPYYWCDKENRVTSEDFYCAMGERSELND